MHVTTRAPMLSRLERMSAAAASCLLLVGGMTLIGWWLQVEELVQPWGVAAPLQVNPALAFTLLALGLVGWPGKTTSSAVVSLAAGLIAAATAAEHLFSTDWKIDQLLGVDELTTGTDHPGRMGMGLAVCILLAAAMVLWRWSGKAPALRRVSQAIVGSLIGAAGLSIVLAYGADLSNVYSWGGETATAPVAAIGLILIGVCLVLLAWDESMRSKGDAPAWAPIPPLIVCLTLTAILWIGLRAREQFYALQTTQAQMDQFAAQSKELLDRQTQHFERMARVWGGSTDYTFAARDADAALQLAQDSAEFGCVSIAFVDLALRTIWIHPRAASARLGFNHGGVEARRVALNQARASNGRPALAISTPVQGPNGLENGFVIYAPVLRGAEPVGFIAAEFLYQTFFRAIATSKMKLNADYRIALSLDGEPVFNNASSGSSRSRPPVQYTYLFADHRLRIGLSPTASALAENRRYLPEFALAAGFGISVLLGLSVHLARGARAGQRAAELLNLRLSAENEERRRVEARLKVSDERLRLALDSTQIGIFEWNVAAGQVYYGAGLWAMLGYEHTRMPSTVEAWQSLIHPDDLPVYRRRIESQLSGIASFIEPEYRVRARDGDWRWVYTRSKSVALNGDGRPTRIIGTVQDVTARREAEHALRESQSEARKLSLVAAKTDSPVLIGSPDGRIEWANEAFCRVMEYRLEEVIGKDPAHFMFGPETNLRTIARIRAAMARGQGISTDVVNYSKSGRKYHLHVEIQPVHGASGELENFIAVETDITGRVETELQLRRAKADADDASRSKSEFLASMSHEIRTPMNGVIGMTGLLLETTLSHEQRDYVSTIRTSGEALLTIINDILDFSKIESGKMELDRSPFELSLCIEEALDLFALQAAAKKIELGYHIATDIPTWIIGDVTRLRQVIVNLVNNAVKFTPSGSISIEVRRAIPFSATGPLAEQVANGSHTSLEFVVRDTGIGIPADRLDRLFKAFSQVDSSTTRKYGGTGLGLAICQRLCELMGGTIRVESSAGQGTSFIFTIQTSAAPANSSSGLSTTPEPLRGGWVLCVEDHPVTQARLKALVGTWGVECVTVTNAAAALDIAATRARPPALLIIDADEQAEWPSPLETLSRIKCPRMLLVPFGQTPPAVAADGQPCANTSKPIRTIPFLVGVVGLFQSVARGAHANPQMPEKVLGQEIPLEVLLAEDNAVNQKVALRFLERLGYRADAVANGLEAVTTLQNRRYDLVLMDLQMPEMDGMEATRQIRRRLPRHRQPKIVALTANAMQGDRELCVSCGMDDYISKPVKMHEIAEAIRRHFGQAADVTPVVELVS